MKPETIQFYRERVDEAQEDYCSVLISPDVLAELLDAIDPPAPPSPPADTIRVRIAVAVDRYGAVNTCAIDGITEEDQAFKNVASEGDIARAIVVADIPRLVIQEVAGRVEEVRHDA